MVISYYDGYFPYTDGPHDMKFIVSLSVCIIDFKGNDKLLFKKFSLVTTIRAVLKCSAWVTLTRGRGLMGLKEGVSILVRRPQTHLRVRLLCARRENL